MKTYTGTFKSYSIDELTEKAKDKAYTGWYQSGEYYFGEDNECTLKEFCRIFDVKCERYEYDAFTYNYSFSITEDTLDDDEINLSGIRLATYLWNNYAKYINKGKYYSLWSKTEKEPHGRCGKLKSRYSKVMKEMDNCPLTGYYLDNNILEPIIDCLTYKRLYKNYRQVIDECLNKFFAACQKDCEYCSSIECFIEEAQVNDWEYDVDGNMFHLPKEFQETA